MPLWKNGSQTASENATLVNQFTVGTDYILDDELIPYDVEASIAHAEGLAQIGILSSSELKQLQTALNKINDLHQAGNFTITQSQEDGHTAIEDHLIDALGDVGKKIHTGRSRNDQVLVAMRMWERDKIDQIIISTEALAHEFLHFAQAHEFLPMPGFTHTQTAMPSSVGMWAGSFCEMLIMNLEELVAFRKIINRSPLGSAAGFGVGFDLPREAISEKLGFDSCLQIALTSQNTRGKIEADFIHHLSSLSATLAHFANDIVWFSSSTFKFFTLPDEFTTGSSIMPQKKNVDPAELIRASHTKLIGYESTLKTLTLNLISGYHRDLQLSKEPTMKAVSTLQGALKMTVLLVQNLSPNEEKLLAAFDPSIFAADQANALVEKGTPFRDAYKQVKSQQKEDSARSVSSTEVLENLKQKQHLGAPGNLGLQKIETKLNTL